MSDKDKLDWMDINFQCLPGQMVQINFSKAIRYLVLPRKAVIDLCKQMMFLAVVDPKEVAEFADDVMTNLLQDLEKLRKLKEKGH